MGIEKEVRGSECQKTITKGKQKDQNILARYSFAKGLGSSWLTYLRRLGAVAFLAKVIESREVHICNRSSWACSDTPQKSR